MQLLLFSILAICIAGFNTQIIELPPSGINVINPGQSSSSSSSTTISSSTATTRTSTIDNESPENDDDNDDGTTKTYDYRHDNEHGGIITVDVHNILDIFKQQLHQTEERILAAIQHHQLSNGTNIPKSYRTADRD